MAAEVAEVAWRGQLVAQVAAQAAKACNLPGKQKAMYTLLVVSHTRTGVDRFKSGASTHRLHEQEGQILPCSRRAIISSHALHGRFTKLSD